MALTVPDPETLPATPIVGEVAFRSYAADAKPMFIGHYERLGSPAIDAQKKSLLLLILFYNGIERLSPVIIGIVHHDVDEHWHQETKDLCTVPNLSSVHAAVPG